jgi:endoglucanase
MITAVAAAVIASPPAAAEPRGGHQMARSLGPHTRFYTPPPSQGANGQIAQLKAQGHAALARRIRAMVRTPQAVWLTGGTPTEVAQQVSDTVALAQQDASVPIFVTYDVPGRDCGLYSAGGAADGAAYRAWVDGFVNGLGSAQAIVVVEPDGLALLPSDCGQPDTYDRVSLIRYAAHAALADPNASIYIDAGHSNWNEVPRIASRLVEAGVLDVNGFSLNTSNYQFSPNSIQYGKWISKCIAFATVNDPGGFGTCPDQYGSVDGVALSPFGKWSDHATRRDLNTAAENRRYSRLLGATEPTVHFVIDTSRNGVGPWPGSDAHPASDPATQDWCNPPDRGLGRRPTAETGVSLLDAYLWIKTPGESDGECYRWTSGPTDPVRAMRDPAAGVWFPDMATELVHHAVPSLR